MAKRKAPYVCIEPAHLRTEAVRSLSSGRSPFELYCWLLMCPLSRAVPGVIFAGLGALRDELPEGWTDDDIRRCLNELTARGLVLVDTAARILYLPELLRQTCNAPVSSTQVVYWRDVMDQDRSKSAVFDVAEAALLDVLRPREHLYASYLAGRPLKESDAKKYLARMRSEAEPLPDPLAAGAHAADAAVAAAQDPEAMQMHFQFRADAQAEAEANRSPTKEDAQVHKCMFTSEESEAHGIASSGVSSSGEGSNPSPPTDVQIGPPAAASAGIAPLAAAPPVVPDDFLALAWPAFVERCGRKLGLQKWEPHRTLTGLPESYDDALRDSWSCVAAAMSPTAAATLWQQLGDLVAAGRLDKLTAPIHRRWMVFVKHFERYAHEARQIAPTGASRPRRVSHRTYDEAPDLSDPVVAALARRVAPELVG